MAGQPAYASVRLEAHPHCLSIDLISIKPLRQSQGIRSDVMNELSEFYLSFGLEHENREDMYREAIA